MLVSPRSGRSRGSISASATLSEASGSDTRASLGAQGDHGNPEQNLVPHEGIHDHRFAVVGEDVGLLGEPLVILGRGFMARGRRSAGHEERAQRLPHDDAGGIEASGARDDELGRYRPSHDDVRTALRHADFKLAVATSRLDVRALDGASNPRGANVEAELFARRVEVAGRDEKLMGGHSNARR